MPDTPQSQANLLIAFADNTTGAITPQNVRDFVMSTLQYDGVGWTVAGPFQMVGNHLYMHDSAVSSSGGGDVHMARGTIWMGDELASNPTQRHGGTIQMMQGSINMNEGNGPSSGGNINMDGGQIKYCRLENRDTAPTLDASNAGTMYFDTGVKHFFGWDGTQWLQLDN